MFCQFMTQTASMLTTMVQCKSISEITSPIFLLSLVAFCSSYIVHCTCNMSGVNCQCYTRLLSAMFLCQPSIKTFLACQLFQTAPWQLFRFPVVFPLFTGNAFFQIRSTTNKPLWLWFHVAAWDIKSHRWLVCRESYFEGPFLRSLQ